MDLRLACGQSSVVSGRNGGLRLESTQAHSVEFLAPCGLLAGLGFSYPLSNDGVSGNTCVVHPATCRKPLQDPLRSVLRSNK